MKTNFFEQIAALHPKGSLLLNIQADSQGTLTLSAVLRGTGESAAGLPPMLLCGTAQELDEGFFAAISAPVQQTRGLLTNLETYQKELDKAVRQAKDKSKAAKMASPADSGEETDDRDEESGDLFTPKADDKAAKAKKKRLYDEQLQKVKTLAQQMKYAEALAQLPDAGEYPDKSEDITAKRQELEKGKALYDKLKNQFND